MDKTSLLLGLIGLFVGAIAVIVFNYFRNVRMAKKAESVLEKALKDAEKIKKDHLLEAKEEAYKLKVETEKDIKERKSEIKEIPRAILRGMHMEERNHCKCHAINFSFLNSLTAQYNVLFSMHRNYCYIMVLRLLMILKKNCR